MMNKFLALLFLVVFTTTAQAQSKVGHVNTDAVIALLPSYTAAQKSFETYANGLMTPEMKSKGDIIEAKYKTFQAESATMGEARKEVMMKEIMNLEQELKALHQKNGTQTKLAQKEQELFAPVQKAAADVINKVAKANGFAIVFDSRSGIIYAEESVNLLPLIQKELTK